MSYWTKEKTHRLIALWVEGLPAGQIATQLGDGVSRSAVLGKARRLGLKRALAGPPARSARPKACEGPSAASLTEPTCSTAPVVVPASPAGQTAVRRSILTIRAGECRWPLGRPRDATFGLCGAQVQRGAFCLAHAALGYQRRPFVAESLLDAGPLD
ncbi:GcrA family cell cycle regulator [Brevundimonas sp.]|jgi:GcrA cell cycle regulator|uniref:GcrA family cell cycle regulator n=1 Tax=Brevundimonas sp. TaxID=1871086 RepID=UPI00356B506B